jgi:SAM-dependent methyltransferase
LTREQPLVFGEIADDYALERPAYPEELIDDVIALAGGRDALEVGAGTGKATAGFVARGMRVLALEPSAEMAAVGRRVVPAAEFVVCGIEDFETDARFDLVYAAQSWHWVDPECGFRRAHELLRPGGLLALFWNRGTDGGEGTPLRRALDAAYDRLAPELRGGGRFIDDAIWGSGLFTKPEERAYPWSDRRTTESYIRLLGTHSNHRMLPEDRRAALQAAVAAAIEAHGGTIDIEYVTRLHLARRR